LENATLIRLLDASRVPVFDDPSVYPVVLIYRSNVGSDPSVIDVDLMVGWERIQPVRHPYRMLRALPQSIWGFLLSEGVDIVEKLLPRTEMLSEICEVNASTTAAEADEFGGAISEEEPQRGRGWKIVNTGTIDPYRFLWGDEPFSNDGKHMLR